MRGFVNFLIGMLFLYGCAFIGVSIASLFGDGVWTEALAVLLTFIAMGVALAALIWADARTK